jgi:DNA-binding NarL/FixJ family response regulator
LEILFVEDSETDTKLVVSEIRRCGYAPRWERVTDPAALRDALRRQPWDLVISDSSLPRFDALQALAVTKAMVPTVPFIVVTGSLIEDVAVQALRRGAADYVTKDNLARLGPALAREIGDPTKDAPRTERRSRLDRLAGVIVELRTSMERPAPSLADALALLEEAARLVGALTATSEDAPPSAVPPAAEQLTPRQREVLVLMADGHSTKQIAKRLKLSVKTVETHRAQIMERLDIHDLAGLVRWAIRWGLVPLDG